MNKLQIMEPNPRRIEIFRTFEKICVTYPDGSHNNYQNGLPIQNNAYPYPHPPNQNEFLLPPSTLLQMQEIKRRLGQQSEETFHITQTNILHNNVIIFLCFSLNFSFNDSFFKVA